MQVLPQKNKLKGYFFILLSIFTLGILESIFNTDEEINKEYTIVKKFIASDNYLSAKYGKIISFSSHPSFRQYIDSSIYNTSVQYHNNKAVYLECKVLKSNGKLSMKYIKEYESNFSLIKNTFNKI